MSVIATECAEIFGALRDKTYLFFNGNRFSIAVRSCYFFAIDYLIRAHFIVIFFSRGFFGICIASFGTTLDGGYFFVATGWAGRSVNFIAAGSHVLLPANGYFLCGRRDAADFRF